MPSFCPEPTEQSCHPSGQWRGSAWPPHRDSVRAQILLEIGEAAESVMEDGGSQGCVGVGFAENFDKMGRSASAAGGDHRNADGVRDGSRQLTVEACAGAVTIHGGEENL